MRYVGGIIAALLVACGDTSEPAADGSSGEAESSGGTTMVATTVATTMGTTGSAEESGEGEASSTGEPAMPDPPTMLPTPTGACPELVAGDVELAPAGIAPRQVKVWMSDAASTMDGPFVFYWHGTGSQPDEALYGLGASFVDQVVAQGGIVVAPYHDPTAGEFPWFLVLGEQEDDLLVADEVLACAIEQVGVDISRIHTIGMSAGGLQTAQMSFRRSGYIASAVPYSGGFVGNAPPDQDPSNPLSAMIFHGGENDVVIISFKDASERYLMGLQDRGGFGFICDHGMGHSIPQGNAQASVWQFFYDHPFGTKPSPYADGLPDGFPDYCALP
jgi:predicted esterase